MSSSSSSFRYPPGFPTWCCECLKKHHLPLTKACKAAAKASPVVVSSGTVDFELILLSSDAIGTGAFSFSVGYSNLPFDPDSGDQVIGTGFQYTQDVSMAQGGDGSVSFRTAERTHEQFPHHPTRGFSSAKNNTAALLARTGRGTRFDALWMQSRGGVTSHFHGFHSTIGTPGRLKSFSDRHGNTQKHHWGQVGGRPRLMHVIDSYGRKSHFAYNDSSQNYRMREVTDFWGRKVNFQYDADGRLLAIVGPSITRGANSNSNIFPNGVWFTDDDVTTLQPACETIFTGRQYDPETQIYYYRARYYHPVLGRFVTRDPIDYADGMNLYNYVGNNPIIYMDSNGLEGNSFADCWNYWFKKWLEDLKAKLSDDIKDKLEDAVKDCGKETEKEIMKKSEKHIDRDTAKEFAKCVAKKLGVDFAEKLASLAADVVCCMSADHDDGLDPIGENKNNPDQMKCFAACYFSSCRKLVDPGTYSIKGAAGVGVDEMECEERCCDGHYKPE